VRFLLTLHGRFAAQRALTLCELRRGRAHLGSVSAIRRSLAHPRLVLTSIHLTVPAVTSLTRPSLTTSSARRVAASAGCGATPTGVRHLRPLLPLHAADPGSPSPEGTGVPPVTLAEFNLQSAVDDCESRASRSQRTARASLTSLRSQTIPLSSMGITWRSRSPTRLIARSATGACLRPRRVAPRSLLVEGPAAARTTCPRCAPRSCRRRTSRAKSSGA